MAEPNETEQRGFWRKLGPSPGPAGPQRRAGDGTASNEWLKWVLGFIIAGVVSYFTTTATMQARLDRLEEREQNHYGELIRIMTEIQSEMRAARKP